jgi:hypothetical protein
VLKREREALERGLARVNRRDARLHRDTAERKRSEAEVEREIARSRLNGDNSSGTT